MFLPVGSGLQEKTLAVRELGGGGWGQELLQQAGVWKEWGRNDSSKQGSGRNVAGMTPARRRVQ